MKKMISSIIPIPMNLGQPNLGLDRAPSAIISSGLPQLLGDIGWRVKLLEPFQVDTFRNVLTENLSKGKAKNCYEVGKVSQLISQRVLGECTNETFPLILGGDHCISIGTISAIKRNRKNAGIVWVDAHADINTPESSISGNMHGMPLALLLGLVEDMKTLPAFDWFQPCVEPKDIVYIGLRDLDAEEKRTIRRLGIKAFTMFDIDQRGIGRVMADCVDYLSDRTDIHLSFDIDAIDPFFAPHTGTAVTGGLNFRESNYICEALFASGKLSSMELVEVDPSQHKGVDPTRTIDVALTLIGSAMGKQIL